MLTSAARRHAVRFVLSSILAVAAAAQAPELLPRAALLATTGGATPRLSPDGRMLAYVTPQANAASLFIRKINDREPKMIATDRRGHLELIGWQHDSQAVLFRQDREGDDVWHIYQYQLGAQVVRDLTPLVGITASLAVAHSVTPHQLLVQMVVPAHGVLDVFRVSLVTGELLPDTLNPGAATGFAVDNEMQIRGMIAASATGGGEIHGRVNAQSPWKPMLAWTAADAIPRIVGFNAMNTSMRILTDVKARAVRLLEVDLATGESRTLAEDPTYDVSDVLIHQKTQAVQAVRFLKDRSEWSILDPEVKADFAALKQIRDGDWRIVARDAADATWVAGCDVDDGPTQFSVLERPSRKSHRLMSDRPSIERYRFAKTSSVSFKARDGLSIPGYLTIPAGVEAKALPTVVKVHEGPWIRDTWGFDPEVQWLANRGYAVLQVNFRGSAGLGRDFLDAGNREWGGKMNTDLVDAKNWVVAQGVADPKRIGIMGENYGGYASLVAMTATPEEFTCAVAAFAPTNLVALVRSVPPTMTGVLDLFSRRIGSAEREEPFLRSRSPLFSAQATKRPVLVVAGAKDPRALVSETTQFVDSVRKAGKSADFLVFEDESSGLTRTSNRLKYYAAVEAFLAKHLGGRAEPPTQREGLDDLRK